MNVFKSNIWNICVGYLVEYAGVKLKNPFCGIKFLTFQCRKKMWYNLDIFFHWIIQVYIDVLLTESLENDLGINFDCSCKLSKQVRKC